MGSGDTVVEAKGGEVDAGTAHTNTHQGRLRAHPFQNPRPAKAKHDTDRQPWQNSTVTVQQRRGGGDTTADVTATATAGCAEPTTAATTAVGAATVATSPDSCPAVRLNATTYHDSAAKAPFTTIISSCGGNRVSYHCEREQ